MKIFESLPLGQLLLGIVSGSTASTVLATLGLCPDASGLAGTNPNFWPVHREDLRQLQRTLRPTMIEAFAGLEVTSIR